MPCSRCRSAASTSSTSCSRSWPRRRPRSPRRRSRVFSVFAPKGGVGKTTIAFNLAVALAQTGDTAHRTRRRQPPVRRHALAAAGAGRCPVDPRSAHRPHLGERPLRCPVARPVGHRHPARAAARRDGRDGHVARRGQDPVAPAPGLQRGRHRYPDLGRRDGPGLPRRQRHGHRDRDLRLDDDRQHACHGRDLPSHRLLADQGALPAQPLGFDRRHRTGSTVRGARARAGLLARHRRTAGRRMRTTRACPSCSPIRPPHQRATWRHDRGRHPEPERAGRAGRRGRRR